MQPVARAGILVLVVALAVLAGWSPYLSPPAGLHAGLVAFQFSVWVIATALILGILLLVSSLGVLWPSFVHVHSLGKAVTQPAIHFAVLAGAVVILYVVIVVIGLAAFNQNVALSPAQVAAQNVLRRIATALIALEVVVIGRAIVLAGGALVSTVRGNGNP